METRHNIQKQTELTGSDRISGNNPNELIQTKYLAQDRMRRRGVPQARSGAVDKIGLEEYIRGKIVLYKTILWTECIFLTHIMKKVGKYDTKQKNIVCQTDPNGQKFLKIKFKFPPW